ncbi:MAG: N-acetyltransferase [Planctomycetales bacterium]|nr:N-acetyltransferase [Planctomycetales bacterium]
MRFRPFLNSDPPAIARVWSAQPPQRGQAERVSARMLNALVYSKPYFDRHGLIVAEDNVGRVIGFVHAGFGPNEQRTDIGTDMGVVCALMVSPSVDYDPVASGLLHEAEQYLRSRGAKLIYAGGISPLNPFYLGLYGGSELPGILASDARTLEFFLQRQYEVIDRCVVFHRSLGSFRSPIDRKQLQIKRRYRVEADSQYVAQGWWEACTSPPTDTTRYELMEKGKRTPCGSVLAWSIEPLSHQWGQCAVGVYQVTIEHTLHRQGLATFLNVQALTQMQLSGVRLVEAQTMVHNTAAIGLYEKLGFERVDEGCVLRRKSFA